MTNSRRPGAAGRFGSGRRPDSGADADATSRHVLIYDDGCAMCCAWVDRVRRWDRRERIEFVPSHGADVGARFPWITRERLDQAMQVVAPGGTTHEGAAAAEVLLRVLPLGGLLAWMFAIPGARAIAARVYRAIAARRCRAACAVHGAAPGARR